MNALCWNFNREDHQYLVNLELFRTLQCGDGTLMHPIFRTWGQERSNFQLELHRESNFSMASRTRQVFEFLVQTVLEGLFVKKEEEKLDLGGEDGSEKMVGRQDSYNARASEALLNSICDIMFAHANRYLRMKGMYGEDDKDEYPVHERQRFSGSVGESEDDFAIDSNCPRDLANYINKNGGHRAFTAKQKLKHYLNDMKAQMLVQKITEAGDVSSDATLTALIRSILSRCRMGAVSLAKSIELLVNRDYRALAVIKNSTWEELGLEEPELTLDEKAEITGLTVEEYKKIAGAATEARQEAVVENKVEEEKKDEAPATEAPEAGAAPAQESEVSAFAEEAEQEEAK